MEVTIASVDRQGIFKRKYFSTITVKEYLMVQHWTAFRYTIFNKKYVAVISMTQFSIENLF